MAPLAILLHNRYGKRGKVHRLRFRPECENGGMLQTIDCFERIFPSQRRMRQMAIVTRHIPTVGGMCVGNVGIGHNMTVHTRFRRVDEIRSRA